VDGFMCLFIHLIRHKQQCKKQSRYSPGQALRAQGGGGYRISRQSAHEGGRVVSHTHRPPLPARKYSWYSFLLETELIPAVMRSERLCSEKFR
jgi:hypothetical protein